MCSDFCGTAAARWGMTDIEGIIRRVVREELDDAFSRHLSARSPAARASPVEATETPATPKHPPGSPPDMWLAVDAAAYYARVVREEPVTDEAIRAACDTGELEGHWLEREARWIVLTSALDRWLGRTERWAVGS